ncbi:hypothetical protein LPJ66_011512, partial [Kickxella alabastrina]
GPVKGAYAWNQWQRRSRKPQGADPGAQGEHGHGRRLSLRRGAADQILGLPAQTHRV